jgi:hypothetical protein
MAAPLPRTLARARRCARLAGRAAAALQHAAAAVGLRAALLGGALVERSAQRLGLEAGGLVGGAELAGGAGAAAEGAAAVAEGGTRRGQRCEGRGQAGGQAADTYLRRPARGTAPLPSQNRLPLPSPPLRTSHRPRRRTPCQSRACSCRGCTAAPRGASVCRCRRRTPRLPGTCRTPPGRRIRYPGRGGAGWGEPRRTYEGACAAPLIPQHPGLPLLCLPSWRQCLHPEFGLPGCRSGGPRSR